MLTWEGIFAFPCGFHPLTNRYDPNNLDLQHEAGFDAFLTGFIFSKCLVHISESAPENVLNGGSILQCVRFFFYLSILSIERRNSKHRSG